MEINAGIDVIELSRFKQVLLRHGQRFLNRIYTEKELDAISSADTSLLYLCLSFSLKEASWKALPPLLQKQCGFRDIEIFWHSDLPRVFIQKAAHLEISAFFTVSSGNVVTLALLAG